ncbi:hypothetical protein [Pantoea sp. At-9b]|uniref:hypothetical protein n=1 Tax=Pantoea sp. (strain At-9b) TaxID=592316 RepID=UPI0001B401CC|nr:hypothetical protein [Pantoea sp. At-9b]ADU68729.1 hypothetical protein Pat9b_1411 [Pantoea sp. At-9b]
MKIKPKDLLAWDIVSVVLDTVDPMERKYLSDVIYSSINEKRVSDIPGAFDTSEVIQYTSQNLFLAVKYVLGIVIPIYLDGFISLSLEDLKERYKRRNPKPEESKYNVNHTPKEVEEIILSYCVKNKITKEVAESIANAVLVSLFLTKRR